MSDIVILEAFSRLKSLRQNVPDRPVDAKFVDEFHHVLDLLEKASGVSLQNFRVPASELRRIFTGGNYLTGERRYSDTLYCDHAFFVMKVDGVLTMFELLVSQGSGAKPPIGFKPTTGQG